MDVSNGVPEKKVRQRGKKVAVPAEQRDEILRLKKIGHSIAKISELTPFSRWTVHQVIKEARGEVAVKRERRRSTEPVPAGEPVAEASPAPEVSSVPVPEVEESAALLSAAELSAKISAAVGESQRAADQLNEFTRALESLWERAERASQMEESFTEAMATFKVLRRRLEDYETKMAEIEAKNMERAVAVHSESSLLRGR